MKICPFCNTENMDYELLCKNCRAKIGGKVKKEINASSLTTVTIGLILFSLSLYIIYRFPSQFTKLVLLFSAFLILFISLIVIILSLEIEYKEFIPIIGVVLIGAFIIFSLEYILNILSRFKFGNFYLLCFILSIFSIILLFGTQYEILTNEKNKNDGTRKYLATLSLILLIFAIIIVLYYGLRSHTFLSGKYKIIFEKYEMFLFIVISASSLGIGLVYLDTILIAFDKKTIIARAIDTAMSSKIPEGYTEIKKKPLSTEVNVVENVSSETRCNVCQGTIKKGLRTVVCDCGKTYHEICSKRVASCPHCNKLWYETKYKEET